MNIPDKAVDAASDPIYDYIENLGGTDLEMARNIAHAALKAAAPYITAQALRDEADAAQEQWDEEWDDMPEGYAPEPVITVAELRLRAEELDPQ